MTVWFSEEWGQKLRNWKLFSWWHWKESEKGLFMWGLLMQVKKVELTDQSNFKFLSRKKIIVLEATQKCSGQLGDWPSEWWQLMLLFLGMQWCIFYRIWYKTKSDTHLQSQTKSRWAQLSCILLVVCSSFWVSPHLEPAAGELKKTCNLCSV